MGCVLFESHCTSAACLKWVTFFVGLVLFFVFPPICHIGSSGENHSWQLFYSFFCLYFVQFLYLYFCNIKNMFFIVKMPVDNKMQGFYVY